MLRTEFISTGFSVPDRVLTNDDLKQWWDTSDEWIRERSGIEQRHWVEPGQQAGSDLALEATRIALLRCRASCRERGDRSRRARRGALLARR